MHYNQITETDIEEKYSNLYAISRLTVTTANLLSRFKKLNKGKPWKQQIKPLNFVDVGFHTLEEGNKAVKPLAPFSTDPQKMVHEPFIDYETGEIKQGVQYFKPLSKTIIQYINHPESKYDGDIGLLKRKHIQADRVSYIGKEANNIDEQPIEVTGAQVFINEEDIMKKILNVPQKQAIEYGIDKSTFQDMKRRIEKDHKINLNTPAVKRLIAKIV